MVESKDMPKTLLGRVADIIKSKATPKTLSERVTDTFISNRDRSLVIAEHILFLRKDKETTTLQLIKLAYLCHGWVLALRDKPLLTESVEAWKYGPVIPNIYDRFKSYAKSPIDITAEDQSQHFSEVEAEIIRKVVEVYADYSGWQLSSITHKPGTPWDKVYDNGDGIFAYIPNALIQEHYKKLAAS